MCIKDVCFQDNRQEVTEIIVFFIKSSGISSYCINNAFITNLDSQHHTKTSHIPSVDLRNED